ncbi:MFS transporter [Streptomyces shenzhenensis]|uniref:MFS transporter n=1 Tax=Streptomyces shenzhenensis TaxID=943815 RepID=UPI00381BA70C
MLRASSDANRVPVRPRLGKPFWRLWWADAANSMGNGVFLAAVPLIAVTLTKDPRQISIISAATYLPWLLASLPAGAIVDRWDRVTLMRRCQLFQAVVTFTAALVAATGAINVASLAVAVFLIGTAEVIITNAAQAVLPQLVPSGALARANANREIVQTVGQTALGQPLGSLLFAAAVALPLVLDATTFVVSAILLAALPRMPVPQMRRAKVRTEVAAGLRWLGSDTLLRTLALLLGGNTFFNRLAFATFVLFATGTLGLTAQEYSVIMAAEGVGSIIGGFLNTRLIQHLGMTRTLMTSLAINAAIYIGIGLAGGRASLAVLLGVLGLTLTVTNVLTVSLRQHLVPDEFLGRVNSVYRMLGWGLMPFGALAGGLLADQFGFRAVFFVAGGFRILLLIVALPVLYRETRDPRTIL